jgi:hypothetical protein
MSVKNVEKIVLLIVAFVFVLTGYVRADKAQLLEKLNADVKIQLDDVTITEALEEIGQKAGMKIALSDEAVWKLPRGEAMRLSVTLEGSLADGMTEMLNAFFMRYAVGDDEITIYPRQELEHVIGRPNTQQLELLKKMYGYRIEVSPSFPQEKLVSMIRQSFGEISFFPYDMTERMHAILQSFAGDKGSLPVTLPIVLEHVGSTLNTPYWYLSQPDSLNPVPVIRLVGERDFREARLDQVVDISFKDERVDVILQRLAGWAGMELSASSGSWLSEKIDVSMQNVTLRQALRNIVSTLNGRVGSFNTAMNQIQIYGPVLPRKEILATRTAKSSGGAGDGYVGKISIPMDGGKYFLEFMLRESDLTEELRRLRDETIRDVLSKSMRDAKLKEAIKAIKD